LDQNHKGIQNYVFVRLQGSKHFV